MSLSFLDRSLLNLFVAPIREEFALSDLQFSFLQGMSFALVYSLAAMPMAALADRRSRRWVIIGSIAAWSGMTVLFGLAGSFAALVMTRAGVALGEAGLGPTGISLIRDMYPPERQSITVAVFSSGVYIGGGLALIIGGPLHDMVASVELAPLFGAEVSPWRLLFVAAGSLGLLAILLCLLIPDQQHFGDRSNREEGWKEFWAVLARRRREALSYLAALSGFLALASAVPAWMPALLMRAHHWSPGQTGVWFGSTYCIAGIAGATLGGLWADRLTREGTALPCARVVRSASLMAMAGGIGVAEAASPFWSLAFGGVLMAALGAGMAVAALGFQALFPAAFSARAVAFYLLTAGTVSLSLGPTSVPWFAELMGDGEELRSAFAVASSVFGLWCALLLTLLLRPSSFPPAERRKLSCD